MPFFLREHLTVLRCATQLRVAKEIFRMSAQPSPKDAARQVGQPPGGPPRQREQTLPVEAARLRRVSVSDYVRAVSVPQARLTQAAGVQVMAMTAEEQMSFWNALYGMPADVAQRRLGSIMRGKP